MKKLRERKYYKLTVTVLKLLLFGFIIYAVYDFLTTVSQSTLYIIIGIILSWRIWKFMLKLLWLFIQIGISFYVIYLLII